MYPESGFDLKLVITAFTTLLSLVVRVRSGHLLLSKAVQTTIGSGTLAFASSSAVRAFFSLAINIWVSIFAVPCAGEQKNSVRMYIDGQKP